MQLDTYLLAASAISIFTQLLTASINTTLLPILTEVEEKEGKKEKIKQTNNFINIIMISALILIIIAFVLLPILVKLMAPGFEDEDQFNLAVILVRIGLPAILFSSINGILVGFLHSEGKFAEGAAISVPLNTAYIIFLFFFMDKFGVIGLMLTSVIGV